MGWMPEQERRRGERRRGAPNLADAPGGRERRSGLDRRAAAGTALVVAGVAAILAVPTTHAAPEPTTGARQTSPAPSPTPTPSAPPPTSSRTRPSPLAGATWYVDPNSSARQQADAWRLTRPADAAQMDKIAATGGQAKWFGDWNSDVLAAVDQYVTRVREAGALPVLVAYNIPNRDCGQHSGGGAANAAAYRSWIRGFALGIATRPAVVILEPDAIGHLSLCGTEAERQERLYLLWDAVQVLRADRGTLVYVDAGHSRWLAPEVAAERLAAAGVADANGFSVNVSNFNPTASEVSYGQAISARLGGAGFVIDTSRNGLGPASTWCNPGGQALGARPTAHTGAVGVDGYLWVKHPGQSDGTCNGGPNAGTWWPDYALGLAQRAAY